MRKKIFLFKFNNSQKLTKHYINQIKTNNKNTYFRYLLKLRLKYLFIYFKKVIYIYYYYCYYSLFFEFELTYN